MNEMEKLKVQARDLATEISILRRLLEEKEKSLEALAAENVGLRGEIDLLRHGNEPRERIERLPGGKPMPIVIHKGTSCGPTVPPNFFVGVKNQALDWDRATPDARWFPPGLAVRKLFMERAVLEAIFKSGKKLIECVSPLPFDARIVSIYAPQNAAVIWFYFASDSFPPVEGEFVPEMDSMHFSEYQL